MALSSSHVLLSSRFELVFKFRLPYPSSIVFGFGRGQTLP